MSFCLNPCQWSFFLSVQFNESTFLLLTVGALYAMRRKKWWLAGLLSFCVALTKVAGVLIVLPFVIEAFRDAEVLRFAKIKRWKHAAGAFLRNAWPALFAPLGTGTYLFINWSVFGDPLQFLKIQEGHWGQNFGWFASNVGLIFGRIFKTNATSSNGSYYAWTLYATEFAAIALAFVVLVLALHRLRASYAAYGLLYLFVILSPTTLLSAPRYMLGLVMLFPCLALVFRKAVPRAVAFAMFGLAAGYSIVVYSLGYHLM
jgi:hypothetical protein